MPKDPQVMRATPKMMTASTNPEFNREVERDRLLVAALAHIPFDGWTEKAFVAGAADCDMHWLDYKKLFPDGAHQAIEYFNGWADRQMIAVMGAKYIGELSIRKQVALAVRIRLEVLSPHREVVRRTLSYFSIPLNTVLGMRCLYRTVDAIWNGIDDRATDFNFYTKRTLLAAVVSTTTLCWIEDSSESNEESWSFLDRRIADVMKFPMLAERVKNAAAHLPRPLNVIRQVKKRFV